MVINYKHFNVCILFPEVNYCCSIYNVPPTICSHLLTRTLLELCYVPMEPIGTNVMWIGAQLKCGGGWSLMCGDLCFLCTAVVIQGLTKAQHCNKCKYFMEKTYNTFSAMLAWTTLGRFQITSCTINHLSLEENCISNRVCLFHRFIIVLEHFSWNAVQCNSRCLATSVVYPDENCAYWIKYTICNFVLWNNFIINF